MNNERRMRESLNQIIALCIGREGLGEQVVTLARRGLGAPLSLDEAKAALIIAACNVAMEIGVRARQIDAYSFIIQIGRMVEGMQTILPELAEYYQPLSINEKREFCQDVIDMMIDIHDEQR